MLNKIIRFSVKNKLFVGIFMLLWVAYGAYQLSRLPIDAVPDITNNQVQIITSAPALGAEDVERLITFPVEQAISNIAGLKESRSMSRFGLSIVTIVFDDHADVYWARQQVSERLAQVEIDANASRPELAPVTTGLGEIYQYVLRPRKGYEQRYSLADLRTTQDWVVRRQLLGTPGVADVSTFGGDLKQYEVAVNPARLKAMNLTITDVFSALSRNNQNTGGAYIEKGPAVLYIRSMGLAGNIDDIKDIVVRNTADGIPVLISQVADVRTGSAVRYGALTMAGKGELTGGIVMMLKGGNSSDVIEHVKMRINEIQQALPEGLVIEPFLDRTKMVSNAISTVEHNLLEGALIVVLVLVLFLGNFRAGIIVASVIPLSMLFAVSMMNLFGVSGNLMSLGALDFGLIVDGAVIIVEAILHHMHFSKKYRHVSHVSQAEMDEEVTGSAARMMNAAVFGQVIILIVYLPILSLSGVEGKMFKPMAQTVAFAILGAFILSLTYVPMISSLVISKRITHKPGLSDRMMSKLEVLYSRVLQKALKARKLLVSMTAALFTGSVAIFMNMGGEFIPQLEEGDFAVETRLLVGTNLTTTINAFDRITNALKKEYPEVIKIVSRIGSAEIPTDPMPIEGGDMIIVLKDKKTWTSAGNFTALADKMAATVQQVMPGVTTSFQYPVQMRFNELMTGAKQDVVCKIYGEDLGKLSGYADQLGDIARSVKGTADLYIEKVNGMPQIVINYNRRELAKFGIDIEDANKTVNAAFAGAAAGKVYEGEKKFDLVVRVGSEGRKNIEDVRNLPVSTRNGTQIPLYQVADIREVEGPNQIQRENTRRRIMVGFNVRGRDVQSIVEELQQKVKTQMKPDAGYTITYGGAFENLQQAKSRLSIAVPVALVLIFIMLYFAFSSVKEGALIYTAIPLSAIGGVLALALRGMPFSISAGVGFIALFGVAVLNGIVLIAEFNRLKKEDVITDTLQLIMAGTRNRLRPVLMTAAVASLGFLPMALSNGAGAEVQRPLATVVIGGLITATLLTLFVLPALYYIMESGGIRRAAKQATLLLVLLVPAFCTQAQSPSLSLPDAITIAMHRNAQMQGAQLGQKAAEVRKRSAFDIARTSINADYGSVNSAYADTRIGISQSFSFPAVYKNQRKLLQAEANVAQARSAMTRQELTYQVRYWYYHYLVLKQREELLHYADSIYSIFQSKSEQRLRAGEANILEHTSAETQRYQVQTQLRLLTKDMDQALQQFNYYVQDIIFYVPETVSTKVDALLPVQDTGYSREQLPSWQLATGLQESARQRWLQERARLLPEVIVGYNNQSIRGVQNINGNDVFYDAGKRFHYVSAGLGIPLYFRAQSSRANAAKLDWEQSTRLRDDVDRQLDATIKGLLSETINYRQSLSYYETSGLSKAAIIIKTATEQSQAGEIDYLQWTLLINQAISVRNDYINLLSAYNQSVLELMKIYNQ